MKSLRLFLLVSILSSCGYRWQPDDSHQMRPSLTVPYVVGDEDGFLTAEIIRVLSHSGLGEVVHRGGDYRLQVTIDGAENELIGFRRDPQKVDGKVRKNLLACEGRKTLRVTVALYAGDTIAYGPYQISADADYDYVDGDSIQDLTFINTDGIPTTVLPFSLGQLEPNDSAQEAANRSLYARIAQKIVDVISSEW